MTQHNWPGQPSYGQQPPPQQPVYGRQGFGGRAAPNQASAGYRQPGFGGYGQPGFGGSVPSYGPAPTIPGPPKQRHPLRLLMIALIAVAGLALIGFAATSLFSSSPTTQYQNDDYKVPPPDTNPPPIPLPETYEQAKDWVDKSPFYQQMTPVPVRCTSLPINVTTATDDQLKAHFEGLMECLVRVWQPPVTNAGFQIVRPTVTIYGEDITTKCGKSGVNAFYCSADQQVYYSNQLPRILPETVRQFKWTSDVVMAHEFGHALQGRTGILISAHALGQNSGSEATDLEYTRRLETQADCFSGMFVRAVSLSLGVQQSDLTGIENIYKAIGDDTLSGDPQVVGNHGLARSRLRWGTTGLGTNEVGQCNTFVAPANQVR